MRTRTTILIGALLLVFAGAAQAQQEQAAASSQAIPATQAPATTSSTTPLSPTLGRVDFGFRGDSVDGDFARYNRFRDTRQGGYLDRFRFEKETETWFFHANANNVGYRDQRYGAQFQNIGKLKVNFDWNQIPLFISNSTRWLYTDEGNGVLTIDPGIRQSIQNAGLSNSPAAIAAITNGLSQARPYDLRSRRDIGTFNFVYAVNRDVDVKFNLRNTNRSGYNLMSFGFGTSPGLNPVVELGVPLDDRTTDIKGSVEFANSRGLLSVGYNGSWFDNSLPTVQFSNPLRATDAAGGSSTGGPASGLVPMWPTNTSVAFNVNGSYKLPAKSRATAAVSIGRWRQDEALVAPTINSALALVAPPLERATANTKANIVSMLYGFNSRPVENVWLTAKYRYYDYANKTPRYDTTALIGDWAVGTAAWENEPSSWKRKTLDVDAAFTPLDYVEFGAGYSREDSNRYIASGLGFDDPAITAFRIFENTDENLFRVFVDSTGNQYVTLRLKYEHSKRTGTNTKNPDLAEELLAEVGEQPGMRQFDIANRDRDRTTATVTVTPIAQLALNGSVSTGRDKYPDTTFGLRDNKNNTWSAGFDVLPVETVSFGVNYGYEKYTALQYSRTANPLTATDKTFLDPTRDWWDNQADKVKTFTASADLLKTLPKTDIRVSYDISDGDATYVYSLRPDQTVFTTTPLAQLAPLKNKLTGARFDVQYFLRPNVAVGATYWYEDYNVNDFSLNDTTINQLNPLNPVTGGSTNSIYSGYLYRNYTAHTGWLRLTYLW